MAKAQSHACFHGSFHSSPHYTLPSKDGDTVT